MSINWYGSTWTARLTILSNSGPCSGWNCGTASLRIEWDGESTLMNAECETLSVTRGGSATVSCPNPTDEIVTDKDTSGVPLGPTKRARSWSRHLIRSALFVIVMAGCICVWHVPLLRSVAQFLVVNEPMRECDTLALFLDADAGAFFEEAAQRFHAREIEQVIVFEGRLRRVVQMGIVPRSSETAKQELAKRGVPEGFLVVIQIESTSEWDQMRAFDVWLKKYPSANVIALSGQFSGRRLSFLCNSVLGSDARYRIHWRSIPDRRFDASDWWKRRLGILSVFQAYMRLGFSYIYGEPKIGAQRWDPDMYQRTLMQTTKGL